MLPARHERPRRRTVNKPNELPLLHSKSSSTMARTDHQTISHRASWQFAAPRPHELRWTLSQMQQEIQARSRSA